MLNFIGLLDNNIVDRINYLTTIKFKDHTKFKTPESLVVYEHNYLDDETLLSLCQEFYQEELSEPVFAYVGKEIIEFFRFKKCVPVSHDITNHTTTLCYLPELGTDELEDYFNDFNLVPTTIHYYARLKQRLYGGWDELLEITGKAALDLIFEEAISQGAPDLTISTQEESTVVYFNRAKRKVKSRLEFSKHLIEDIIKVLTMKSPIADITSYEAKYVGYEVDEFYRSRVVINRTIQGYSITIRLYRNEQFNETMESLNLNKDLIEFLRSEDYSKANGLRLIVGETMSGKNTTALTILNRVVEDGDKKVVSIEMPVEQVINGVEQVNSEYIEDYVSNINSLIHQNPDFVYVAETKDITAKEVMRIANTGKKVLTTLHANSVVDTIFRLVDITDLSVNRILQVLHSVIYQQLVRDGEGVKPLVRFVHFTDDLKEKLYDKPFGEIVKIVRSHERGDNSELL